MCTTPGWFDVMPTLSTGTSVSAFEGRPGDALSGRGLVAWNLRRVRVAQGVSQERLEADAGVDRAYLGGLERLTQNPTVDLLDRVAGALSVPLGELFVAPRSGGSTAVAVAGRPTEGVIVQAGTGG